METEKMINELRNVAKKHENDKLNTFDTNITAMCTDVANKLEELNNKIIELESTNQVIINNEQYVLLSDYKSLLTKIEIEKRNIKDKLKLEIKKLDKYHDNIVNIHSVFQKIDEIF